MPRSTPLRRELLYAFGLLLGGAVLVAVLGLLALLPLIRAPEEAALYVSFLLVADLAVLFVAGGAILRNRLVAPVEALVKDVHRIAGGDYEHRVRPMESPELQSVQEGVNAMADRLIRDQRLLAENVASLDRTNQELVEARSQVVRTARLASVGTLAAGVAHEVGNPLGAVIGYVDVARRRARSAGVSEELQEILDDVREEADRIDRIVRGLLDYARPRDTDLAPHDPLPVLERVRDLLETQGRLEGVTVEWRVEEDADFLVIMEPHRLEQVMVNLILNGLDALEGRDDPRLRVAVEVEKGDVARLPYRREGDPPGVNYMHRRRVSRDDGGKGIDPLFTASRVVLIRVEDNGPGIAEEDLERVFDPFFTTKEPGRGTGLGLSICARLVEGMAGRIEAGRSPDGGAAFLVRLPMAPRKQGKEGEPGEPGERGESGEPGESGESGEPGGDA